MPLLSPRRRAAPRGGLALLLALALLPAACGDAHNAELVVVACQDQDGTPLPDPVTVTVNGVLGTWRGQPLRFPLTVSREVELVTVKADAGGGYVYVSKRQFDVRPGAERAVTLRFFRPYRVTVEAVGRDSARLAGVAVYAGGQRLGETDDRGRLVWLVQDPARPAGLVRPGTRFSFTLERDGKQAEAEPVVIEKARFVYATEARLDVAGPAAPAAEAEATVALHDDAPARRSSRAAAPPRTPPQRTLTPRRATLPSAPEAAPPVTPAAAPQPSPAETPQQPTLMEQGQQALAAGSYAEAVALFNRVRPTDPAYKQALNKIGEARLKARDYEGAVTAYREILKIDPTEYAPHNNLAAVYLASQNILEADHELDQVLAKKHLIPLGQRNAVEREARYHKAVIQYTLFQNERDLEKKKNLGYRSLQVLQRFVDLVPEDAAAFASRRREIAAKRKLIKEWLDENK